MEKVKKVFNLKEEKGLIVQESHDFIESELQKTKRVKRYVQQSLLLSEEIIVAMLNAAPEEGELRVSIQRDAWNVVVKVSAPGEEMDVNFAEGSESEADIRNVLFDAYSDKLSIKNRRGYNSVRLTVGVKAQKFAFDCLLGILLGTGLFLITTWMFPYKVVETLSTGFFERVTSLVMNMFHVILGPVIFLSIISVSAKIANARSYENDIGIKTLNRSLRSSAVASVIGILSFALFDNLLEYSVAVTGAMVDSVGEMDFFDILFSLVPQNLVSPFIEGNILQIVFMAMVIGVAINFVTDHSNSFLEVTDALYELTSKIVSAFGKCIPFGVFCTSYAVCYRYGVAVFYDLIPIVGCVLFGMIVMFIIYILNIVVSTRLNPFIFLKKVGPNIISMFRYGSGVDALQDSMRFCRTKLGVSPEVYNITLPFGAQFNLDGTCIYMAVIGLSLAKLCGISMYGNHLITMIFSIMVLSIGAPNLAGSNIVCLLSLLTSIGVAPELVAVIMCIDPLLYLGIAVLNTVGDNVMSLCIAYQKGLLNKETYNRI